MNAQHPDERRASYQVGKKRVSVVNRRSSFLPSNRRKSSTPAPDAKRRSVEPSTLPLVGRQSVLEEEKPKDRLPVGAFPKGLLEYPPRGDQESEPSRLQLSSGASLLGYDTRASIQAFDKRMSVDGRKRSQGGNISEIRKYSVPKDLETRKQSLAMALSPEDRKRMHLPVEDRRQSRLPNEGRRQSIPLPSDGRRQSLRGPSDGRRQSIHLPVEGGKQSLHSESLWDSIHTPTDDRKESMAYAHERTTASSIYGRNRRRASSFVDAHDLDRVSVPSIGFAGDVDLDSASSSASARTMLVDQRYIFESRFEHFLIFVCYTLGFHNLWTFTNFSRSSQDNPSIVHHIISYVCVAMPMLYMEMFIGQYSQRGVLLFGRIIPLAYGFGWAVLLFAVYLAVDVTVSMGDALFYFIVSFAGTPWMDCSDSYNTNHTCIGTDLMQKCLTSKVVRPKICFRTDMQYSAMLFVNHYVVQDKPNWSQPLGGIRVGRLVCTLLSWVLITLTTLLGFNQYKRILQIGCFLIVTFLLVLLVLVMSTHNEVIVESIGEMFLIHPGSLSNMTAWTVAILNALREMCLCQGGHVLFGSFMSTKTEGDLEAILFGIACIVANLVGGLFSQSVAQVLKQKMRLHAPPLPAGRWSLYITIPQGLGTMHVPQLLSILYFSMLFIAIYQNQVVQLDVIVESIIDAVPKTTVYRKYMVSMFGVAGFILGVPYSTGLGNQLKKDLESSRMIYFFILLSLVETLCVLWLYGTQKFSDDIHFLLGAQPTLFWKICWRVTPAVFLLTLVYCPAVFYASHLLSIKVISIIYCVLTISPLIVGAVYKCLKYLQYHNLVGVLKSENEWGHPDAHERLMRHIYNPRHETRSRRRDVNCKHRCLKESTFLKELNFSEKMAGANMEIVVEADDKKQLRRVTTPTTATTPQPDLRPLPTEDNDDDNQAM